MPLLRGGSLEPGVTGYLFISKEVVARRRRARTWAEARALLGPPGIMVMARPGTIIPVFLCEQGARRRLLHLETAAADAKAWVETGRCPLRPTPLE